VIHKVSCVLIICTVISMYCIRFQQYLSMIYNKIITTGDFNEQFFMGNRINLTFNMNAYATTRV